MRGVDHLKIPEIEQIVVELIGLRSDRSTKITLIENGSQNKTIIMKIHSISNC